MQVIVTKKGMSWMDMENPEDKPGFNCRLMDIADMCLAGVYVSPEITIRKLQIAINEVAMDTYGEAGYTQKEIAMAFRKGYIKFIP